jgi:hypothetical protein
LLGWIWPGLGQLYVGQPRKAALFLVAILPTFAVGWWLTDFTCVDPSRYGLEFAAHALLGGPTALALELAGEGTLEALPRWFEIGRLYAAVAGLLNLVAICDALGEVIAHNRRVAGLQAAARRASEARAAAAAQAAAVEAADASPAPTDLPLHAEPTSTPEESAREAPPAGEHEPTDEAQGIADRWRQWEDLS